MQNADSDMHRNWRDANRRLIGVWIAYTMQDSPDVICGEILGSDGTNVQVMTMFTRKPPSVVAFPLTDIMSPLSVFVYLGQRHLFEWLHVGAYVKRVTPLAAGVLGTPYDRIRDVFDGYVFLTHSAPVSLKGILKAWAPISGTQDKAAAPIQVEAFHTRCAHCKAPRPNEVANTRPSPPVPTSDRQVVEDAGPSNAWTKIMEE